jgi:hypothetical protein
MKPPAGFESKSPEILSNVEKTNSLDVAADGCEEKDESCPSHHFSTTHSLLLFCNDLAQRTREP